MLSAAVCVLLHTVVSFPLSAEQNDKRLVITTADISSVTRPSPDLQMEQAANYALSLSVVPNSAFSFDASVFHRDITDRITGKVFTRSDNSGYIPGYTVVNARADYSAGDLTVYCDIDNLLNDIYLYVDGYDAPPREWVVGMNYNF